MEGKLQQIHFKYMSMPDLMENETHEDILEDISSAMLILCCHIDGIRREL